MLINVTIMRIERVFEKEVGFTIKSRFNSMYAFNLRDIFSVQQIGFYNHEFQSFPNQPLNEYFDANK